MLSNHNANNSAAGACNSQPLSQQCHIGETAHKPLTLYASPTKLMDSLQPYVQNQLVPLASKILQDPTAGDLLELGKAGMRMVWPEHSTGARIAAEAQ